MSLSCNTYTLKSLWWGFLFLGPPGAGKSTTAQLLGKNHGYAYYEADCFMQLVNPFVDLNVDNPSLAQNSQTPLSVSLLHKNVIILLGIY